MCQKRFLLFSLCCLILLYTVPVLGQANSFGEETPDFSQMTNLELIIYILKNSENLDNDWQLIMKPELQNLRQKISDLKSELEIALTSAETLGSLAKSSGIPVQELKEKLPIFIKQAQSWLEERDTYKKKTKFWKGTSGVFGGTTLILLLILLL